MLGPDQQTNAPKIPIITDEPAIPMTEELVQQCNLTNSYTCRFVVEDMEYIYYRHPTDKAHIYRYEKETGEQTVLFDQNNGFLHGIKLHQDKLYFVSVIPPKGNVVTEGDSNMPPPSLYCMDKDGQNLQKLLDNVGDDYLLLGDDIIFNTYAEENGAWFHMYQYNTKTGELKELVDGESLHLVLVGREIYYIDYEPDGSSIYSGGGELSKINLDTNEITQIDLPKEHPDENHVNFVGLSRLGGKLYFYVTFFTEDRGDQWFCSYDIESGRTERIIPVEELSKGQDTKNASLWSYYVAAENHFYFFLAATSYTVVRVKDGTLSIICPYDHAEPEEGVRPRLLFMAGGKIGCYLEGGYCIGEISVNWTELNQIVSS